MGAISSTIRINDGMSTAMRSMNKALNIVLSSFEKLQRVSANAIDTADIEDARAELSKAAIAASQLEDEIEKAGKAQDNYTESVSKSGNAMNGLLRAAKGLIAGYSAMKVINLSDQMTQTESRMSLIVDVKAGESVDELQKKIMASANRSRASYLDTANAVTSFAQRAGDAFSSNDEVIAFTENLNKMYAIAGATAQEQSSSMLQLTQALGSGVLRGEELNAVFEAAPNIMQEVAEYMNVPIGQLRNMAAEGEITAQVVKNAILGATSDINAEFEQMDMTWQQVMTLAKNRALEAFQPVLNKIKEIANNKDIQQFVFNAASALAVLAGILADIIGFAAKVANIFAKGWSIISPVIYGIVGALVAYRIALTLHNTLQKTSNNLKKIAALREKAHKASIDLTRGATLKATTAQYGFNAALLACPVTWVIAALLAIVTAVSSVIGIINALSDSTISASGVIVGSIMWVGAFMMNLFGGVINFIIDCFAILWNNIATIANFLANVFVDPVSAVAHLFFSVIDFILGLVETAANVLDFLAFGLTDMGGTVRGWRDSLDGWVDDTFGVQTEVVGKIDASKYKVERQDLSDAYNMGYNLAAKNGSSDAADDYDAMYNAVLDIGDSTESIADALSMADEDIKYLRDYAERETINRFTTAEIKVDFTSNNSISGYTDVDGILEYFEDRLVETMESAAEGAY